MDSLWQSVSKITEHIEALELPLSITSKIGRLVGYMELKKNKTNKTTLDVTCENRHDVLRQKRLLIGCGGGCQQECSQSYSPVARWIAEVALRCGTEYVQPHEMCRVVERYLDGPCDSPSHQLRQLLANDDPTDSEHITAVTQLWCEIFDNEETWLTTSVCVTCFAILWLAIKGEGVSSMVATTLDAAAGLAQRQKWGLILPSSARVSLLTYQTVLGVRYPELVKATADGWKYGRYVSTEATLQGGFLPVFWDVPKSIMHAVSDLGALVEWLQANIEFGHDSANNLAVLHNQNRMVDNFGLSAWVTQSKGQVISRSVTSCAGMTAFMVVVAQTKVCEK